MKEKYEFTEIYKTASREYIFQEQKRKEEQTFIDKITHYMENGEKELLAVWGVPGCGKSYLMKKIVRKLNKEKNSDTIFAAYIDISDCADESEVYYRIALQLSDYYANQKIKNRKNDKEIKRLIKLYEWIKGIQKENLTTRKEVINTTAEMIEAINKKALSYLNSLKASEKDEEDIVYDILLVLSDEIPFVKNIKSIIDTALNIKELKEKYKFKKCLLEKIDILDNKIMRQNLFLSELIAAMLGTPSRMIVLDNFQMNPNNELSRDHTWLTTSGKMLAQMDALWIIVSRMSTKELFIPLFGKACNDKELTGFTKELAERYLIENCFNCINESDYCQVRENSENELLIKKMLEICDFNKINIEESEKTYLPYLLRLVVLYYWNLKEDRTITIKPDLFVKINEQDNFVSYYFYKDLSDLLVNAFQILSCLPTWDSDWIYKVREKFDNHLLNAKNLLVHKAPIENLDDNSFKLHEALKDSLYRNGQNYIKKDVLKHLFDSFTNIYGNRNLSAEDRKIWYEQKKIETFIEVVFEYINLRDERENQKRNLERIYPAMKNIYDANSKRGSVSDFFIHTYCWYIDKLGEVMEISFIKMCNNILENKGISLEGAEFIPDQEKQQQIIDYMDCCFKLADLYTNITKNGIAWRLEELCILFWKRRMQLIRKKQIDYKNQVWYYRCWQQRVKAINATAYDYSAEHEYKAAYKFGKIGLYSAYVLGIELLERIGMEIDEERDTLRMMLNPDIDMEFSVDRAYTEIPHELYEKMKKAYKTLSERCSEKETLDKDSFLQILYDLMVVEQQKLRGNYPWYCFYNPKLIEKDEMSEKKRKKEICKYGVRTYWMRRALSESIVNADSVKKMLISYHNICVYLSKCG